MVGEGTTLVSLYIPGTRAQLLKCTQMVNTEFATAQSIKSRTTRQLVSDALKSVLARLKQMKAIPENGIAVFCGFDQR